MRLAHAALVLLLTVTASVDATADEWRDPSIVHVPVHELVNGETELPTTGYLSTGQPTRELLERAADAGYAAVIDLRGADEERGLDERAVTESLGMTYVSIPLSTPADATLGAAAEVAGVLRGVDGPVLLHCASGNRVGALFALNAAADGAADEEALAVGKKAGLTRWLAAIREKLTAP
ncbi:MAG: sulfur transferase domain-containing protein [Pseudomonadota bacterium]